MKSSIRLKNLQKSLEEALMAFRHSMTKALKEQAKKRGCSLAHFEVLKFIAEEGNPTMKDIATQLHITPPSASTLIDTMVAKKLVVRSYAVKDRRIIRLTLAPKGHVFLFSIHKHKTSVFNEMLSRLSMEDKNELARIIIKCV